MIGDNVIKPYVSTEEVVWTFLSHFRKYYNKYKIKYKNRDTDWLGGMANEFKLDAEEYPGGLPLEAVRQAIDIEINADRCNDGVRLTVNNHLIPCRWMLVRVSAADLGDVDSILSSAYEKRTDYGPNGQGFIKDLFPGWKDYLQGEAAKKKGDTDAHEELVSLLRAGCTFTHRPIVEWMGSMYQIRDGRHRIMAAYEVGRERDLTIEAYVSIK